MTEEETNLQITINLYQWLEKLYSADIQTASDLAHYKAQWIKDGRPLPEKKKAVRDKALSVPKGESLPAGLMMKWEDQLREVK